MSVFKYKLIYVDYQWYIIENKIPIEGNYYMVYSLGINGNFRGWSKPKLHTNTKIDKINSNLNNDTVGVLVATNNPDFKAYNDFIYRINKIPEKLFIYNDIDCIYSQENIAEYIAEYIHNMGNIAPDDKNYLSPTQWLELKQFKSEIYYSHIILKYDADNNLIITEKEGEKYVTIQSFAPPCLYKSYNEEC